MINIVKSQPAPICLEEEKNKTNGNYRCGDTYERISEDFFGKCYLCEDDKPTSINIEHFKPHYQGKDKDRKFDWNNLFLACSHCNGIKRANENEILNCTNPEHKITDWIKFDIKPFPRELPKISAKNDNEINDEIVKNTVELLNKIYNYNVNDNSFTSTKDAAFKLRKKIIEEIALFGKILDEFYEPKIDLTDVEKETLKRKIKKHISPKSPFSAFKLWIVKDNKIYSEEFL